MHVCIFKHSLYTHLDASSVSVSHIPATVRCGALVDGPISSIRPDCLSAGEVRDLKRQAAIQRNYRETVTSM
jgi:hypothetical protein